MSKIAVILAEGFEDSEYKAPVDAFAKAGHDVTVVGLKAGTKLEGKRGKETATTDKAFADVSVDGYDALLIPGGHSPDKLRGDKAAVDFVKEFVASEKPIFSICHGPQILITADALKGVTATGYKTVQKDMENAGATVKDEEVVVDGRFVFSRHPGDLPAFINASLGKLS